MKENKTKSFIKKDNKNYDVWVVDPHGRIPGEKMGHLIGIEAAQYYSNRGLNVLLICSTFSHILKQQRTSQTMLMHVSDGLDIVLLKTNSYKSHTGFGRIIWHLSFCLSFLKNYKNWGDPKFITVSFPFPFFDLVVRKLKKETNAIIVLHFSDLWPEIFEILLPRGLKAFGRLFFSIFYWMRRVAMKSADGITFVSNNYNKLLSEEIPELLNKPRVTIHRSLLSIKEMTDSKITRNSFLKLKDNRIYFNYSGTLGAGYDIENLLKAAEELATEFPKKFKIFISGKGPKETKIREMCYKIQGDHVEFLGLLTNKELKNLYCATDFGLLPYSAGTTVAFPAKVFDYIVAGKPIIHSNAGELADFTETNDCGHYFSAGDLAELLNIFRLVIKRGRNHQKLLSKNMSKFSLDYDKEKTLGKMYDFLYDVERSTLESIR